MCLTPHDMRTVNPVHEVGFDSPKPSCSGVQLPPLLPSVLVPWLRFRVLLGRQAAAALQACGGSLERAADWLFSHSADLAAAVAAVGQPPAANGAAAAGARAADAPRAAANGPGAGAVYCQYMLWGATPPMESCLPRLLQSDAVSQR